MYATCLFCNSALGANETLKHFPVGRRIAFDAAKGRLRVVCRTCDRWNLSPLETRWEAIEDAERVFRVTRTRTSAANIALARVNEGTDLVRIGAPMRPEFTAWRYGNQFGSRRRKFWSTFGGMFALLGLGPNGMALASADVVGTRSVLAFSVVGMTGMAGMSARMWHRRWIDRGAPIVHTPNNDGVLLRLTAANALKARIFPSGNGEAWQHSVSHSTIKPADKMAPRFGARAVAAGEQLPQLLSGRAAERAKRGLNMTSYRND